MGNCPSASSLPSHSFDVMAVRADPDLLGATYARPALQSGRHRDRKSILGVEQF